LAGKKSKAKDYGQGFLEALTDLAKEKNISTDILFEAIEAALVTAYKRTLSRHQTCM